MNFFKKKRKFHGNQCTESFNVKGNPPDSSPDSAFDAFSSVSDSDSSGADIINYLNIMI